MAEQGATREGVQVEKTDRETEMDRIADARREAVEKETGIAIPSGKVDEDVDADDVAAKAEADRLAKESADAEAKGADKGADDQLDKQLKADERVVIDGDLSKHFIRAKVDGVDTEISLEKAQRLLQKDAAIEARFEQASRAKKEADELLAKAKESGTKTDIKDAEAEKAGAEKQVQDAQGITKKFVDAMFAGDTDEAAKVMQDIVKGAQPKEASATPVDVEKLTRDVVATTKAQLQQEAVLAKFQTDYPEIIANKTLAAMADQAFAMERELDPTLSLADGLKRAGDSVRDKVREMARGLGMSERNDPADQRADRQSRKAEIDEPSTARSAQAAQSAEDKPLSPSDVIEQMRRQRMGEKPPA